MSQQKNMALPSLDGPHPQRSLIFSGISVSITWHFYICQAGFRGYKSADAEKARRKALYEGRGQKFCPFSGYSL